MLDQLKDFAKENNVPILRDRSCEMLCMVCQKLSPKRILEIGTAIGYSGCQMLAACGGMLTTIEKDEERHKQALVTFQEAGYSNRVEAILGDAAKVLPSLTGKFDLIFLDGPKGQYINYLPILKSLLNKGGVLFADNVYFHGMVKLEGKIPHKNRTMIVNLKRFIEAVQTDKDFETTLYDIEDGIAISKLK